MLHTRLPKEDFFRACRKEGIEVLLSEDIDAGSATLAKMLITVVLGKCLKYGVARERVKNLGQWLFSDTTINYQSVQKSHTSSQTTGEFAVVRAASQWASNSAR